MRFFDSQRKRTSRINIRVNTRVYRATVLSLMCLLLVNCSEANSHQENTITQSLNKPSKTKGSVLVLENAVKLSRTGRARTLRIYLPPAYNKDINKRYAVLYMLDAQNLYDDETSYAGEWGVDESMDDLAAKHGLELIVVGIDNHPEFRLNEYSAWSNEKYGVGEADDFIKDVVEVVKPFVDSNYRTQPDRKHTGMMGSSLGGLASHYALVEHKDVFAIGGVFSPSYWYAPAAYEFTQNSHLAKDTKWYFLAGEKEGEGTVENMQRMIQQIHAQELPAKNVKSKVSAEGEHNERFWRSEFSDAVLWLYKEL